LEFLDGADGIGSILGYLNGFGFSIIIRDPSLPLSEELAHWVGVVHPFLEHARTVLSAEVQRDTLITLFDFPPALSTACEQYLLYFVQFLRDLGIEAEGDVRHRANQVLFSVRPQEGAEALDRIREALAIYLQLPSTPGLEVAVGESVLQLQANIHHLKGQITLLRAVASANQAEIRALDAENQALSLAKLPVPASDCRRSRSEPARVAKARP
jgi:hypothetical protein